MTVFIEVGNTTFKRAERAGNIFRVARFDDVNSLLPTLHDHRVVVAPINTGRAAELLAQISDATVISRDAVADFVSGSHDTPNTLGLDRVLNLIGLNRDGVVISCGTAITVDARVDGLPLWGPILPGFRTAANGLHDRVPVLPVADLHSVPLIPARSTQQSIDAGILLGTTFAVREFALRMGPNVPVTLTGGDATILVGLWEGSRPALDDTLLFVGMESLVSGK